MTFISYAQNFEDVMLWRALKHVERGFYIDVGANDPKIDSVTQAFYERGWHGINIEPLPSHHADLSKERTRDINLQCAVGSIKGEIDLWECDVRGWATTSAEVVVQHSASGHEGIFHRVPVMPLRDICSEHVTGEIHFLKIDVEGVEKSVIEGMDFSRFRPWVLVVEATQPNSAEEVHGEWEQMVLTANYSLAYADGLNRFYVAKEHAELLEALCYPPNVFDDFIRASQLESELRAHQAETRATQAGERASYAEAQAVQANERACALEAQATQANDRARRAEFQAAQASELANEARTQASQANERASKAEAAAVQANERAIRAEAAAHNAWMQYQAIIKSRSWRMTAPMRWAVGASKWFVRGVVAWITLKPGSRPWRTARLATLHLRNWVLLRPRVKVKVLSLLQRFPRIKACIKRLAYAGSGHSAPFQAAALDPGYTSQVTLHPVLGVPPGNAYDQDNVELYLTEDAASVFKRLAGGGR